MNKGMLYALAALLLAIAILAPCAWLKTRPVTQAACSGNMSFYREDTIMRISSKLNFTGESGVLYLSGTLYRAKEPLGNINRAITFRSQRDGDRFSWTSTAITPSLEQDVSEELARRWLPAFYRSPDNSIEIYLDRVNLNSVLVSGELIPYYLCTAQ
ncbi:hypothetical protein [Pantoea sp. 1.19]|uniref:hypothetical protein n=1 Tax=Pantoea sp. 1.19 TaxID=1925589 RepID=UPI00094919B9|nr:hypothetical protein [Pantoea sp. 1.19]